MRLDVITTVLVAATAVPPAGPYDLATLARVKAELDIPTGTTTWDTLLQDWISEESARCAAYCNRVFAVETVEDELYPPRDDYPFQIPGGVGLLQLSRFPLIAPPVVATAGADTPTGATIPIANTAGIVAGMPAANASIALGTVVQSLVANTSVTLSAPLTADLPAGSTVTFGLDVRVTDPPGTVTLLTPGTDYRYDASTGQLVRLSPYSVYPMRWDPVLTQVAFQAGYATIPLDLASACLTLIKHRWAARTRDPFLRGMTIEGVGSKQFWVGPLGDSAGDLPPEVQAVLDRYREYPL